VLKPVEQRLSCLAIIVAVAAWQAYTSFSERNRLAKVSSDGGYSNGFLYCGSGPEPSLPPCSSKQERGNHPSSEGDEAYSFIKLSDRWYAFSQGPG
jgi:hypothetical protein